MNILMSISYFFIRFTFFISLLWFFFFNLLTDLQLFLFDRMWVYERERSGHFKIWPLLPSGGSGCEKLRSGI